MEIIASFLWIPSGTELLSCRMLDLFLCGCSGLIMYVVYFNNYRMSVYVAELGN